MNYRFYNANPQFFEYIQCYWTLETKDVLSERPVVLDHSCIEMIFNLGGPIEKFNSKYKYEITPRSFVCGQYSAPILLQSKEPISIFAIKFKIDGLNPFSPLPPELFKDRLVSIEELYGREGLELQAKMLKANNNEERIVICERFFLKKLTLFNIFNSKIKSCVDTLITFGGQLPINQISGELQDRSVQLQNKFSTKTRLSARQLDRLIKLQTILIELSSAKWADLTDLAGESSFYNHTDFIRDFKDFTGTTPKKFYAYNHQFESLFHELDHVAFSTLQISKKD